MHSTSLPKPTRARAWPGGITPESAGKYLEAGASHVIVTSYLFQGASVRFVCMYVDLARGSSTDGMHMFIC